MNIVKNVLLFVLLLSTANCNPDQQDSATMDILTQNILSGVVVRLGESRNLMQIATFKDDYKWSVSADQSSGSLAWSGDSSNGVRSYGLNLRDLSYAVANLNHTWAHKQASKKDSFNVAANLLLFAGTNIPTTNVKFNAKLSFELLPNYKPTTSHIVGTFPRGWVSVSCRYLNVRDRPGRFIIASEEKPIDQVSTNWIASSVSLVSSSLDFQDCLSRKNPTVSFDFGVSGAYGIKIKDVELQMLNVD